MDTMRESLISAQNSDSVRATSRVAAGDTLWIIAVLLLGNSILRGIRAPDRFACSHLLFNYDFGFTRRALLGTLLQSFDIPALCHYDFCFWFSLALFSANMVLLLALTRQLIHENSGLVALVFVSSLAVVFLSHEIGYLDHVGLLFTLLFMRMQAGFFVRALVLTLCLPLLLLIHDTSFMTFSPVLFFILLKQLRQQPGRAGIVCFTLLLISMAALAVWFGSVHLSDRAAVSMYHELQAKADYPLREGIFVLHTTTSAESLRMLWPTLGTALFLRIFFLSSIVLLPTAIYFLFHSLSLLAQQRASLLLRVVAVAASLLPLLFNLVGEDVPRWTALAATTSFLVFAACALDRTEAQPSWSFNGLWLPVTLVLLNLGSSLPLFNGFVVKTFPYEEHINYGQQLLSGAETFPPRPEQCDEVGCAAVARFGCTKSAVALGFDGTIKHEGPPCFVFPAEAFQKLGERQREFMTQK
jgi:hypothetical protein